MLLLFIYIQYSLPFYQQIFILNLKYIILASHLVYLQPLSNDTILPSDRLNRNLQTHCLKHFIRKRINFIKS